MRYPSDQNASGVLAQLSSDCFCLPHALHWTIHQASGQHPAARPPKIIPPAGKFEAQPILWKNRCVKLFPLSEWLAAWRDGTVHNRKTELISEVGRRIPDVGIEVDIARRKFEGIFSLTKR